MDDISALIAELSYRDPETARRLEAMRQEVEQLGSLREHVGWQRLRTRSLLQREAWAESLGAKVAKGEILNQREIDYMRGWYDCALYLTAYPEVAEQTLNRSVSIAAALRLGDEEGVIELSESVHL